MYSTNIEINLSLVGKKNIINIKLLGVWSHSVEMLLLPCLALCYVVCRSVVVVPTQLGVVIGDC